MRALIIIVIVLLFERGAFFKVKVLEGLKESDRDATEQHQNTKDRSEWPLDKAQYSLAQPLTARWIWQGSEDHGAA
jgi:hypothetical protein